MYKDREKQRAAERERQRRYREKQKGVTKGEGVTTKGVTSSVGVTSDTTKESFLKAEGVTEGVTYPDILDKLTDPRWRDNLEKVCAAFERSNNPSYNKEVWLGDARLSIACDWLKCTSQK